MDGPTHTQGATLDLTSCDREPIHIPGSIQPHGFLLALDPPGRVRVASATAAGFLARRGELIFGATLPALLGAEASSRLLAGLVAEPLTTASRILGSLGLPTRTAPSARFEVVAHKAGPDWTILEFERTLEPVDVEAINARLYNFVAAIRYVDTLVGICQNTVEEVQALTGCDRVVLYRFNEQGHGEVLAEMRASSHFDSYLGLRFPASDVPAQARRMYELNRVRIIPNVDYQPSPLLAESGAAAPEIDLSGSVLRSVSPIHRQYMRNMGTICSMSISIIIEGRLWGLVSCHHHAPRYVPLRLRSACDFLLQIVASQIESDSRSVRLNRALTAKSLQSRLLASMAAQENYLDGLKKSPELLLDMLRADGAAVVAGPALLLFGSTPSSEQLTPLVAFLRQRAEEDVFVSSNLGAVYPEAEAFTAQASGLVAISVSKLHSTHVLWFRRELIETVRWAGDPAKPAEPPGEKPSAIPLPPGSIHPRHSFAEWSEHVRGCSEPWSPEEVAAAQDFRSAVLEIVLTRAEEMAAMAAGLQVANEELEAFSYSVSHDLRAPFRHITGFSEMLKAEEGERLSEQGKYYLQTIMNSARFAGQLVDSLLDFSRFARTQITMVLVDMGALVDSEWHAVVTDEARGASISFTRGPLPAVAGDPQLLRQVLRNLFSNAVKYTSRRAHPAVHMAAEARDHEYIFLLRDNGVGFDQEYAGKLFGVFQRLHRIEEFEGTGIGLANVRRIIGRHGGRTWAEGKVGEGATFYFTMPAGFPPEKA